MPRDLSVHGSQKSALRTDIQALRGFAVLVVVLYHAGVSWLPAGFLGVDVFFVLSGFLITGIIKKGLERGEFSFSSFYYRRAKRLLPAAYTVVLLTIIAAPLFLGDDGMAELKHQVIGAVTFTINFVLWGQSGYFDAAADTKPLLHFWSLAVEEQYYILMPLLLFLLPARWWLVAVLTLVAASFCIGIWLALNYADAAFYLLPARFWELGIGSLCALAPARLGGHWLLSAGRIPAIGALVLLPMFPTGSPHPGADAAIVCLATAWIIMGHDRNRLEELFPVRLLASAGNISYSLYLVHWPVLVFTSLAWIGDAPRSAVWLAIALSVALSVVIYFGVEEPFRRGFSFHPRRVVTGLFTATIAVSLSPYLVTALHSSPTDYEHILRRNYGLAFACTYRNGEFDPHIAECRTSPNPRVIVWGDSYAMALIPGLAEEMDAGLQQATSGACGPAIGISPFSVAGGPYDRQFAENCMRFNDRVLEYVLASNSIDTVIISSPFTMPVNPRNMMIVRQDGALVDEPSSPRLALQGVKNLADQVRAAGKRLVVVAPPPVGGFDIGACLERLDRGMLILGEHRNCEIRVDTYENIRRRTITLLHDVESSADVPVIWLSEFLCDTEVCRTRDGDVFIYRDPGHLSYQGSEYIVREYEIAQKAMRLAR